MEGTGHLAQGHIFTGPRSSVRPSSLWREPQRLSSQLATVTSVTSCLPYLAIRRPLLRFGHPLVHVEHTGDAQLDAVQVAADDSPQPEHASLAGLADLKGSRSYGSVGLSLSQKTQYPWTGHLPRTLQHQPNQREKDRPPLSLPSQTTGWSPGH